MSFTDSFTHSNFSLGTTNETLLTYDSQFAKSRDYTFDANIHLKEDVPYESTIKEFKHAIATPNLDIHPSWSGMNIKTFTKEDLDMQVLVDRITDVLNRAVKRVLIMGQLSTFLKNNGEILRKYMPEVEAKFVLNQINGTGSTASKKSKRYKTMIGFSINSDTERMLRLLTENQCLLAYASKYQNTATPFVKNLVGAMQDFGKVVKEKLAMTAMTERKRFVVLKNCYREIHERKSEIKRLSQNMNDYLKEHNAKMAQKEQQLAEVQGKMHYVLEMNKDRIDICLHESRKALLLAADASEARQADYAIDAKKIQQTFSNLREAHISVEKVYRAKKFKLEAQLSQWLAKYDQDIGERQIQLDEITDAYEAERAEVSELECLLHEQEKLYNRFKEEKEAEDDAEFEEKLYTFAATKAAKLIQKTWRAYRARKRARKLANRAKKAARAASKGGKKK